MLDEKRLNLQQWNFWTSFVNVNSIVHTKLYIFDRHQFLPWNQLECADYGIHCSVSLKLLFSFPHQLLSDATGRTFAVIAAIFATLTTLSHDKWQARKLWTGTILLPCSSSTFCLSLLGTMQNRHNSPLLCHFCWLWQVHNSSGQEMLQQLQWQCVCLDYCWHIGNSEGGGEGRREKGEGRREKGGGRHSAWQCGKYNLKFKREKSDTIKHNKNATTWQRFTHLFGFDV